MTPEDLAVLEQQDDATLAYWWCQLNRWEWPGELSPILTWEQRREGADKARGSAIMWWISKKISHRACLREWNRDRMNDAEFDEWWNRPFKRRLPTE